MLIPAFTLDLSNPVLRKLLTVGKFDGKHPSLTCGTSAGKIFFHSPHEKDPQAQIKFLNINRKISALECGRLDPKRDAEVLLVGAQTTLLCYDVNENQDLFFKDVPDGVNTIVVGSMDKKFGGGGHMALVGGNCSIQGFDHQGEECFWTVTGDNVATMTFCDVDEDGALELLVGSDDYEIRVFQNEEARARQRPGRHTPLGHTTEYKFICTRFTNRHKKHVATHVATMEQQHMTRFSTCTT